MRLILTQKSSLGSDIESLILKTLHVFSPAEKLAEAQRRSATLQNELQSSLDAQRESNAPPGLRKRKTMFHLSQEERCKHHNIKDLKLAFSEFYLSLILLQNYQVSAAQQHNNTPLPGSVPASHASSLPAEPELYRFP